MDIEKIIKEADEKDKKNFRYICPHCGKETKGKESPETVDVNYMDCGISIPISLNKVFCTECGKDMIFLKADTECINCKKPVILARASEHPSKDKRGLFCPWCGEKLNETFHVGCGGIIKVENFYHHGPLAAGGDLICDKCKKDFGRVQS